MIFFPKALLVVFFLGIILIFSPTIVQAQHTVSNDTVLEKVHSPTKAALFSMALPGLGQVYNKKYWKLPIIYAGFGAFAYFIISNGKEYRKYRDAFNWVTTGDSSTNIPNNYVLKYDQDQLLQGKNYYRRNLEVTYILSGLWYVLNILDAAVDAHFFDYDISDDLSLKIEPMFDNRQKYVGTVCGLSVKLKF